MIDPQGQANKWVKNMEKDNQIIVLKQSESTYMRTVENSVQFGNPVLLENVPEALDPALEPLLNRAIYKQGSQLFLRLGDSTVEYDPRFKFYITTKLPNPHFPPEVSQCPSYSSSFLLSPMNVFTKGSLLFVCVLSHRPASR